MSVNKGSPAIIHIDMRRFNSQMSEGLKEFRRGLDSDEFKHDVLVELMNSDVGIEAEAGPETGALDATIEAAKDGEYFYEGDYSIIKTNKHGVSKEITRHAYTEYSNGKYILDPTDEKGQHYGAARVYTGNLNNMDLQNRRIRQEILEILEDSFL